MHPYIVDLSIIWHGNPHQFDIVNFATSPSRYIQLHVLQYSRFRKKNLINILQFCGFCCQFLNIWPNISIYQLQTSASFLDLLFQIDSEAQLRTTKNIISIFPLWTYHLYVATFQQHLQMEYISLSWYDIRELVGHIKISLIEGYC